MKSCTCKDYVKKIKLRIIIYWGVLFLMLVYMVVVGEMGLGDSRIMSSLADDVSKVIFFGGMVYVITKIVHLKRILKNRGMLLADFEIETDKRREYIHYKSGGILFDLLLFALLCITCTAGVVNEVAFRTSFVILLIAASLKAIGYAVYNRRC